jgi:hypothetical protein
VPGEPPGTRASARHSSRSAAVVTVMDEGQSQDEHGGPVDQVEIRSGSTAQRASG